MPFDIDNIFASSRFLFETSFFKMYQSNDGILINRIKEHNLIEEKDVRELLSLTEKYTNNKRYPFLIVMSEFTLLTKEAKILSGSEEGTRFSLCEAVLLNNIANKIIFNTYLLISKPKVPTRAFTNSNDAFEWLREMNNNH